MTLKHSTNSTQASNVTQQPNDEAGSSSSGGVSNKERNLGELF